MAAQRLLQHRRAEGGLTACPESEDESGPVHVADESPGASLTLAEAARPTPLVLDLVSSGSFADRAWRRSLPRDPVPLAGATIRMPDGSVKILG